MACVTCASLPCIPSISFFFRSLKKPDDPINDAISEIWGYLQHEGRTVEIIAIEAADGMGKSTILNRIWDESNHADARGGLFDVVLHAKVSRVDSIPRLQQDLVGALGLSPPADDAGDQSSELRAMYAKMLSSALSEKKFLLLLDDVWEDLDLASVGIPTSGDQNYMKSKIIVTMPPSKAAGALGRLQIVELRCLNRDESRELFWTNVGADAVSDDPGIKELGEEMIDHCRDLPLALIAVGWAMSTKRHRVLWEDAVKELCTDSEQHSLRDLEMDPVLYSALNFAYQSLKTDRMRECLLYCSLFPQGRGINEEQLIDHWIGLGLLDVTGAVNLHVARNIGYKLVETFISAGLLEKGCRRDRENGVITLRDAVRRMFRVRRLVTSDGENTLVAPTMMTADDKWAKVTWASLTLNEAAGSLSEQYCRPELSTLLINPYDASRKTGLIRTSSSTVAKHGSFLQFAPEVRVLDLSGSCIGEIPPSIGQLSNLQYLNLSRTKIKSLPAQLRKLTKLRQLILTDTPCLLSIPLEAISSLPELQLLNLYMSAYDWNGSTINYLEDLEQLDELGLNIKKDLISLRRLYESYRLYRCIRFLNVSAMEDLTANHVQKAFKILPSVKELSICSCQKMQEFKVEGDQLLLLEVLKLEKLPLSAVVASPPSTGALVTLRRLEITSCNSLKDITWTGRLPSLEELLVGACNGMEELITEGADIDSFPKLILMHLSHLRILSSITRRRPRRLLPSLERFEVEGCPQLKVLPLGPDTTKRLKYIQGEQAWWDRLQWRDRSVKETLHGFFYPRSPRTASRPRTHFFHVFWLCARFIKNLQQSLTTTRAHNSLRVGERSRGPSVRTMLSTDPPVNEQSWGVPIHQIPAMTSTRPSAVLPRRAEPRSSADECEDILTRALTPVRRSASKEQLSELLRRSILIDGGEKSFWLDEATGTRCFMLSATNLWIAWGNDRQYWRSSGHKDSRFSQVAELIHVCWLEIRGMIKVQDLSPQTAYTANLIYKLSAEPSGLEDPLQASVANGAWSSKRRVHLQPYDEDHGPCKRPDEWMELLLGDFHVGEEGNETVHFGLKEVKRLNWKGGLLIAGIEVRPRESAVGGTERSMECHTLSARELNIAWVNEQRYWRWRPNRHPRFSEVAELLMVCWFDVNGSVHTRSLSPDTTYSAYLIFGFESNSFGFTQSLEASVSPVSATGDGAMVGVDRRRVYLKPEKYDSFPSPRSDGWMQVELGDFFVDKEADDGETVSFRLQEVERLHWKTGLIVEGIQVTPKKMDPKGGDETPLVGARPRQESKSFVLETFPGQRSYMLCPTDLTIVWGDDPQYWRRSSHPYSRFSEVMELLHVCWLDINGKVDVPTLSPETNYAVYLVFNVTADSYGLNGPQEAWVEFAEVYSSRNVRIEPAEEFFGDPPEEDKRRSVDGVPSTRSDGWMELELGDFYVGKQITGAQVPVKFGLREVEELNWKRGLIVEAVELRPKATPCEQ